jgi:hypothetical protein
MKELKKIVLVAGNVLDLLLGKDLPGPGININRYR